MPVSPDRLAPRGQIVLGPAQVGEFLFENAARASRDGFAFFFATVVLAQAAFHRRAWV